MSWLEIAVLVSVLLIISMVSGQLIFENEADDSPDTLQNRRQFGEEVSQQQFFSNQRRRNGRPRQRPRQTSATAGPGTTTTAQPEQQLQCRLNCFITSEYNPVCGTDGQTYNNMSVLRCAQDCGINVQFRRMGLCVPRG